AGRPAARQRGDRDLQGARPDACRGRKPEVPERAHPRDHRRRQRSRSLGARADARGASRRAAAARGQHRLRACLQPRRRGSERRLAVLPQPGRGGGAGLPGAPAAGRGRAPCRGHHHAADPLPRRRDHQRRRERDPPDRDRVVRPLRAATRGRAAAPGAHHDRRRDAHRRRPLPQAGGLLRAVLPVLRGSGHLPARVDRRRRGLVRAARDGPASLLLRREQREVVLPRAPPSAVDVEHAADLDAADPRAVDAGQRAVAAVRRARRGLARAQAARLPLGVAGAWLDRCAPAQARGDARAAGRRDHRPLPGARRFTADQLRCRAPRRAAARRLPLGGGGGGQGGRAPPGPSL
ncbi:MAG: hypothetical protein AVDCRST_MAG67-4137, partial [uncultured Solirubrobacteraceae bacterium]